MLILMDNLGRPYIQAPQFLLVQCKRRNRRLAMDGYKYIFHGDFFASQYAPVAQGLFVQSGLHSFLEEEDVR
jgi:hypothetical protein